MVSEPLIYPKFLLFFFSSAMANTTPLVTATTDSIPTTEGSLLNVITSNIAKLNASNYLMLSCQVHALLDGYDLAFYLKESTMFAHRTFLHC
ncbi:unnamed protein product [Microthlaspi erraticum]|uniref:Pectinesterase inhibitor domain-containing protein n=1 Tax=Microthlaspi erraticum TaxID=1685480 RepID=A0A6D2IF34_9BRAS|nr:unnamed protein product [Microthlaspi erraticum]